MTSQINVGIIGFGLSAAVFHAPILTQIPQLHLSAIVSSRREAVLTHYPNVTVYSNTNDLFNDPNIDLIIITAPNQEHFPLAKAALENGKHVIVEKPFVLNSQQGEALIALAEKQQRLLSVYHNRRWDNDFMALQKYLFDGVLGNIYSCEIRFERFRPVVDANKWREQPGAGTGILYDLGSHLIDQALCLFGWPKTIYADIAAQRGTASADDYIHLLLGYEKLKVILHASSVAKKPSPRFVVHGDKGSFIKYGMDPQENILRMEHGFAASAGQDLENELELILEDRASKTILTKGDYAEYYRQIYQAITHNTPAPVTAQQALACITLIECAQQSAEQGKQIKL